MYVHRIAFLIRLAAEEDLAAVAVLPGPNMRYLTGLQLHLSERPVILLVSVADSPILIVPSFEAGKAELSTVPVGVHSYADDGSAGAAIGLALGEIVGEDAVVGIEGRRMRFLEMDLLCGYRQGLDLEDADHLFARLRSRKDESELALMRRAAAVAEEAFAATLPAIRPGRTEREVASELTVQLLRAGSEPALPFWPIVASGPNGALPHATPTDRRLEPGDVVTIDWGATVDGYHSDITRNVVVAGAEPHPDLVRAHEVVAAANEAGRRAVRPGATGQSVDRAARKVVAAAGLGERFTHRTGHGIGLEGHEEPYIVEGNEERLGRGMTFTVEPGVYLPGVGGVRIEDEVVVVKGGGECLTALPRVLLRLD